MQSFSSGTNIPSNYIIYNIFYIIHYYIYYYNINISEPYVNVRACIAARSWMCTIVPTSWPPTYPSGMNIVSAIFHVSTNIAKCCWYKLSVTSQDGRHGLI